ncbi:uncharacterized protein LOC103508390, partial [Diaphorina citri]|uniref:Uncharacterized protein LOC103508390 n=1 Tax=Diaphorina citri TaxID=121845 RepID=A0A3Q0IRB3_DIACI
NLRVRTLLPLRPLSNLRRGRESSITVGIYVRKAYRNPNTRVEDRFVLPPHCKFFNWDIRHLGKWRTSELCGPRGKFDFVLLDPPWTNKFIRRKKKRQRVSASSNWYNTMSDTCQLSEIPMDAILNPGGLVGVWCTNNRTHMEVVTEVIFPAWGLTYVATWYWMKVTKYLDPVIEFSSAPHSKQPYERLLFAVRNSVTKNYGNSGENTNVLTGNSARPAAQRENGLEDPETLTEDSPISAVDENDADILTGMGIYSAINEAYEDNTERLTGNSANPSELSRNPPSSVKFPNGYERSSRSEVRRWPEDKRLLVSVPSGVHSHKPPLAGNQVLAFQAERFYRRFISALPYMKPPQMKVLVFDDIKRAIHEGSQASSKLLAQALKETNRASSAEVARQYTIGSRLVLARTSEAWLAGAHELSTRMTGELDEALRAYSASQTCELQASLSEAQLVLTQALDASTKTIELPPELEGSAPTKELPKQIRYNTMSDTCQLTEIPMDAILNPGGLVGVWCTNNRTHMEVVTEVIFPAWGLTYVATWYWMKVTKYLDPVIEFSSAPHSKQPYERLLFAVRNSVTKNYGNSGENTNVLTGNSARPAAQRENGLEDPETLTEDSPISAVDENDADILTGNPASSAINEAYEDNTEILTGNSANPSELSRNPPSSVKFPNGEERSSRSEVRRWPEDKRLLVSVPSGVHSHKPPLADVIAPYLPPRPHCLELFARNLTPRWTSLGNQVLAFQAEQFYR